MDFTSIMKSFEASKLELVRNEARYRVWDVQGTEFTLSMTILNPFQETKGHSHQAREIYFFIDGQGEIHLTYPDGSTDLKLSSFSPVVQIESNVFHKVRNNTNKPMIFVTLFENYKREEAVYDTTKSHI